MVCKLIKLLAEENFSQDMALHLNKFDAHQRTEQINWQIFCASIFIWIREKTCAANRISASTTKCYQFSGSTNAINICSTRDCNQYNFSLEASHLHTKTLVFVDGMDELNGAINQDHNIRRNHLIAHPPGRILNKLTEAQRDADENC